MSDIESITVTRYKVDGLVFDELAEAEAYAAEAEISKFIDCTVAYSENKEVVETFIKQNGPQLHWLLSKLLEAQCRVIAQRKITFGK